MSAAPPTSTKPAADDAASPWLWVVGARPDAPNPLLGAAGSGSASCSALGIALGDNDVLATLLVKNDRLVELAERCTLASNVFEPPCPPVLRVSLAAALKVPPVSIPADLPVIRGPPVEILDTVFAGLRSERKLQQLLRDCDSGVLSAAVAPATVAAQTTVAFDAFTSYLRATRANVLADTTRWCREWLRHVETAVANLQGFEDVLPLTLAPGPGKRKMAAAATAVAASEMDEPQIDVDDDSADVKMTDAVARDPVAPSTTEALCAFERSCGDMLVALAIREHSDGQARVHKGELAENELFADAESRIQQKLDRVYRVIKTIHDADYDLASDESLEVERAAFYATSGAVIARAATLWTRDVAPRSHAVIKCASETNTEIGAELARRYPGLSAERVAQILHPRDAVLQTALQEGWRLCTLERARVASAAAVWGESTQPAPVPQPPQRPVTGHVSGRQRQALSTLRDLWPRSSQSVLAAATPSAEWTAPEASSADLATTRAWAAAEAALGPFPTQARWCEFVIETFAQLCAARRGL